LAMVKYLKVFLNKFSYWIWNVGSEVSWIEICC